MIGRLHHVILDCPDPRVLARFYSQLLGDPVTYETDTFCVVAANDHSSGIAFQFAAGYVAPTWPDPTIPQQVHLDVMVDDPSAAGPAVEAIGARAVSADGVYADPAGHLFCLIPRPSWAPLIEP